MSHATSIYRHLEDPISTRFLRILPSTQSEQLSVELVHGSLASRPVLLYEALSYTWGDPLPSRTILCNGLSFEIRENAYNFLERIRRTDTVRTVWMDCICINQDDIREREQQVGIMDLIYQLPTAVLVWLGRGDTQTSNAMKAISQLDGARTLLLELEEAHFKGDAWYARFGAKSYFFDDVTEDEELKQLVQAYATLYSRPWFHRIWVQQEVAFCQEITVLCGSDEVSWEKLVSTVWLLAPRGSDGWPLWTQASFDSAERAYSSLRRLHVYRAGHQHLLSIHDRGDWEVDPAVANGDGLGMLRQFQQTTAILQSDHRIEGVYAGTRGSTSTANFANLARDFSGCGATDHRDKVYALYGLRSVPAVLTMHTRPKLDYNAPWQTVFTRTAKWLYQHDFTIVLHTAGRSQQHGSEIPSWVPDYRFNMRDTIRNHAEWHAGGSRAYRGPLRFLAIPRLDPRSPQLPTYSYTDSKGKKRRIPHEGLELTVLLQDRIVFASPIICPPSQNLQECSMDQILHKTALDLQHVSTNIPLYFTGESGLDAYSGTIIVNTTADDKVATADFERSGFAEWKAFLEHGSPKPVRDYHAAVENSEVLKTNRFCITAHGFMCLAPAMTEPGDYVAIVQGIRVPVALRKVGPPHERYYELLGQGYIHRMMRGRAMDLIEEFKCKYQPGSEDETADEALNQSFSEDFTNGGRDGFPFNAKSDYRRVIRTLGKRRVVLV